MKLNFDNHVSTICKKASNKLNALSRIHHFLGEKEKEILKILRAWLDHELNRNRDLVYLKEKALEELRY